MNNKLIVCLNALLLVGLLGLYYLHFADTEKIAYVDSAKLLNNYQGMQEARKAYQQKMTVWQANIDTLSKDVQAALQKHQQEIAKMNAKEQKLSEELVRTKQQQLVQYQKAIQEKAAQEDRQMTQSVITEVNNYISEYGNDRSYKVILVANESGTIAYAQEGMDVTEEVLNGLNANYKGE